MPRLKTCQSVSRCNKLTGTLGNFASGAIGASIKVGANELFRLIHAEEIKIEENNELLEIFNRELKGFGL